MMTSVPTKIVLKSTTRMSLNDRFSNITPTIQNIRANMANEQQVSAANRRLAQQLANRPGIQNPTANMYQMQQQSRTGGRPGNMNVNVNMNKRSLQQRLGKSNIKNRLSMPAVQPIRGRGRGRGRGGIGPIQSGGGDNQWISNRGKDRGGFSPRGVRGRGSFRARGRGPYNRFTGQNTLRGGRGGGGVRGSPRGMRRGGGRGPGRGRGAGGRGANSNVSIQDLDNQLDEYMARSKSHLDAELDAYMSEVNK